MIKAPTLSTIAAMILASCLASCSESSAPPSAPPSQTEPAAAKEIVKIDAKTLFSTYEDNEVAADESFKEKLIEVSGKVQSIDKDAFDSIVINFKTDNEFMPAHMKLEDSEKATAMALKKGVKATVRCEKMARIMGSPYGSDCRFVAEEPAKGKNPATAR